jgi:hypothetical protein
MLRTILSIPELLLPWFEFPNAAKHNPPLVRVIMDVVINNNFLLEDVSSLNQPSFAFLKPYSEDEHKHREDVG